MHILPEKKINKVKFRVSPIVRNINKMHTIMLKIKDLKTSYKAHYSRTENPVWKTWSKKMEHIYRTKELKKLPGAI